MARRKIRYPELKPMSESIRLQFLALIEQGKEKPKPEIKSQIKPPKGALWRWDTLEDVDPDKLQ